MLPLRSLFSLAVLLVVLRLLLALNQFSLTQKGTSVPFFCLQDWYFSHFSRQKKGHMGPNFFCAESYAA
jgi:hypothetical protein